MEAVTLYHTDSNAAIRFITAELKRLSKSHYALLCFIFEFFHGKKFSNEQEMSAHEAANLMSPQNMGIVFGPNLFPKDDPALLLDSRPTQLVAIIIRSYAVVFGDTALPDLSSSATLMKAMTEAAGEGFLGEYENSEKWNSSATPMSGPPPVQGKTVGLVTSAVTVDMAEDAVRLATSILGHRTPPALPDQPLGDFLLAALLEHERMQSSQLANARRNFIDPLKDVVDAGKEEVLFGNFSKLFVVSQRLLVILSEPRLSQGIAFR